MHANAGRLLDFTSDGGYSEDSDSWWGRKFLFATKERFYALLSTTRADDGGGTHKGISMVVSQEDIVC